MTDYDYIFFWMSLAGEAGILVALLAGKLTVARFTAASFIVVPLMLIFGLSARVTKVSVGAVAIETQVDQARTYASEIKGIRDKLLIEQKTVGAAVRNLANTSQVVEELAAKNLQAGQKLDALDAEIKRGETALGRLDRAADFLTVFVQAQNDRRSAFDRLQTWSKDEKYPLQDEARQAVKAITRSLSELPLDYSVPWKTGVDPRKFTLDDLTQQYIALSDDALHDQPNLRAAYIQYVSRRTDFTRHARLQFMIDRMKHDRSIKALSYACAEFARLSGLNTGTRTSTELYDDWWEQNARSVVD